MSYMTTTMFAPRIWGFDLTTPQVRVALAAGWSRADLVWEGLMQAACAACAEGDMQRAAKLTGRAAWVARLAFARGDLRRATVLANRGVLAQVAGKTGKARALLDQAVRHWDASAEAAIADMQIAPRARSSLFHLRMEARHRQTYHDNMRTRFSRIAAEVREALDSMARGQRPECRLYSRWLGERPNVYDDTRKVLSACLLIMEPTGKAA